MSAASLRGVACRCWLGTASAPAQLLALSQRLAQEAAQTPGRVQSAGRLEDPAAHRLLSDNLPTRAAANLRSGFEWYVCRGAGFHTDAHYGSVLFGVWCLDGPPRDIVFAPCAARAACPPGTLLIFDPFRPHAVLDAGETLYRRERYVGSPASVFLGFEIELAAAVCEEFGIAVPKEGAIAISSSTAVNAESGMLVRAGA